MINDPQRRSYQRMLEHTVNSGDDSCDDESFLDDEPCVSLFDPDVTLPSVDECVRYDAEHHRFDIRLFRRQRQLTFYDVIKLVNFARASIARGIAVSAVVEQIAGECRPWDQEQYLKPVIENDPLLFSFDDDAFDAERDDDADIDLRAENAALRDEIEKMRQSVKYALGLDDDNGSAGGDLQELAMQVAAKDREYFNGYSQVDIHEEMLRDAARTHAYEAFCNHNRHLFEGKVVVDVGCGSGILSLFAARAGARRVIGIDNAEIARRAQLVVKRNGYGHIIQIIQGKVEEIELDCKVDVIISEWMGYFLLFESMLSSVLVARDRFLVDPASVYPDQATLFVAGAQTRSFTNRNLDFWKDLYGFDLTDVAEPDPALERCRNSGTASIATLPADAVFTDSARIKQISIGDISDSELDFEASFTLQATRDETLDAIISYFTVDFSRACTSPVKLTTAPEEPYTHWKQTVFMLGESIALERDQLIIGHLHATRPPSNPRSYNITLELNVAGRKLPPQCFDFCS